MPKISVIIPIFGVEKYIERCARSLFQQTLNEIEYIFVDDCTRDNSIRILEKVIEDYPQHKNNVTILHHDINRGLPQSRLTGFRRATGDYIIHCDSDDWIDVKMYNAMYLKAIQENADMVVCDYIVTDGTSRKEIKKGMNSTNWSDFVNDMLHLRVSWSLCNKLVKRDCFKQIIFPEGNMGEDMAVTMQIINNVNRISYLDSAFYYYFKNPVSISHSFNEQQLLSKVGQYISNVRIVENYWINKERYEQIKKGINYIKYNAKIMMTPLLSSREYEEIYKNTFSDVEWQIFLDRDVYCIYRIRAFLTVIGVYLPFRRYRNFISGLCHQKL